VTMIEAQAQGAILTKLQVDAFMQKRQRPGPRAKKLCVFISIDPGSGKSHTGICLFGFVSSCGDDNSFAEVDPERYLLRVYDLKPPPKSTKNKTPLPADVDVVRHLLQTIFPYAAKWCGKGRPIYVLVESVRGVFCPVPTATYNCYSISTKAFPRMSSSYARTRTP
jgi:hypothetical protein